MNPNDGREIAALVVSLPERHRALTEALTSVRTQTRRPEHTLVGIDPREVGEQANMNRLITAALEAAENPDGLWLAFLHDDDTWWPRHLSTAVQYMDDADIIVAQCKTTGGRPPLVRRLAADVQRLEGDPDTHWSDVMRDNWFPPSAVVVRASVFGRWTDPTPPPPGALRGSGVWLDWSNWRRLYKAGARYRGTGAVTVSYRFDQGDNGSWQA